MLAALKVINDSLHKTSAGTSANLVNASKIVQKEWFQLSSTETANPNDVEDYLDCFEEYSSELLRYMVNLADTNVSFRWFFLFVPHFLHDSIDPWIRVSYCRQGFEILWKIVLF